MADEKPNDPADLWRSMLGDWEKSFNTVATKAMAREDFAKAMGAATGATTTAQATFADLAKRHLETMNLPSRADLANIGERLQVIEAQLNHLTRMVQTLPGIAVAPGETAPKPARTRQPPAKAAGDKTGDKI